MKKRVDSRSPQIDTEACVANAGGQRFNLVLIAAQRLRELRKQHQNTPERVVTPIDALLEIQEGKVNPNEYLAKVGEKKTEKVDRSRIK